MKSSAKKMKQLSPIIRIRKSQYEREIATLNAIRIEKENAVEEMNRRQSKYLAGINELNTVRQSQDRMNLETMELGIDLLKNKWMDHYRQIQDIERRESEQTTTVSAAAQQLKMVEKLFDKHQLEFRSSVAKKDQEKLDEFSLQKIVRNR